MEWISHDDRTLKEHLFGLKEVADKIIPEKTQNFFGGKEFENQIHKLIAYHDLAKASVYFQLYLSNALVFKESGHKYYSLEELKTFIKKNNIEYKNWQNNPELKRHALLGAWMSLYDCGDEIEYKLDSFLFLKILEYHHGHLKNFCLATTNPVEQKKNLIQIASTIDFEAYSLLMENLGLPFTYGVIANLLESFRGRRFDMLVESLKKNTSGFHYFKTLFLYSILLSADKGDMMLRDKKLNRKNIPSQIVDDFKAANINSHNPIDVLREEAYQVAVSNVGRFGEQNFFSITLPTGLGKTFTAYKVALLLKEQFCPSFRIIYCLPFTSIIDQNADIFKEILANSGFESENIGIHHHLAVPNFKDDEDDSAYPNWEYLTEGWHNEITITTFVQFWESIFACHNRQIRKFHNLANSIIILDEVQAINPELYPAFEFVMEQMARYFNTKFVLVTATQPILLKGKTQELCAKEKEDFFFKQMNRTKIDQSILNIGVIDEIALSDIITNNYQERPQSILVVCNTIRFSQKLFEVISENLESVKIYYLSAAIIPFSREEVLKEIQEYLQQKEPIILVSTQVVEAGVDIDFDIVYRDFAPLSSINQAAGRCNRNDKKGASKVFLFNSGKTKIYDPTQLDITRIVLKTFDKEIPENLFYEVNQQFFEGIKEKIQNGSILSKSLINDILTLQFENVGININYRLIREKYKSYNYFIPITNEAEILWQDYLSLFSIDEHFKRKQAVKVFMPKLMKFVIRIPEYAHRPDLEEQERAIIFDEHWEDFYDGIFGYKKPAQESVVEIF